MLNKNTLKIKKEKINSMYKKVFSWEEFTYKTIFFGGQKNMNEQNNNNEKKIERVPVHKAATSKAKKQSLWLKLKKMDKEKRFYLYTAVSCAVAFLAILILALVITNTGEVSPQAGKDSVENSSAVVKPEDSGDLTEKPVVNTPEGY